jgi:hypothetical protein
LGIGAEGVRDHYLPRAVADHIHELIDMPPGKRPIRSTVGHVLETAEINHVCAALQHEYLVKVGLDECEEVAVAG